MSDNNHTRQEIIDSLLNYLPAISISLSKIVTYLQDIIKNETGRDLQTFSSITSELDVLLVNLDSVLKAMSPEDVDKPSEVLKVFVSCMSNILNCLRLIILWFKDEQQTEEMLINSVNNLYTASQQLITLVDMLTK